MHHQFSVLIVGGGPECTNENWLRTHRQMIAEPSSTECEVKPFETGHNLVGNRAWVMWGELITGFMGD